MIHNMGEYINEINLIYIFSEVIDSIMSQCVNVCVLLFGKKNLEDLLCLEWNMCLYVLLTLIAEQIWALSPYSKSLGSPALHHFT